MNLETEMVLCLLLMLLMFSSLRSWVRFDFFLQTPFQNITWTGKYLGRKRGKKVPVDDPRSCFVVWLSHFSYIPLWLWRSRGLKMDVRGKIPFKKKKKKPSLYYKFLIDMLSVAFTQNLQYPVHILWPYFSSFMLSLHGVSWFHVKEV